MMMNYPSKMLCIGTAIFILGTVYTYPVYADFSFNSLNEQSIKNSEKTQIDAVKSDVLPAVKNFENKEVLTKELPSLINDPIMNSVPALPVSQPTPSISNNTNFKGEIVEGFGSGIPLVIAVRQIVPARYAFVFDDSIDLGVKVDWQGGRPWNDILSDIGNKKNFNAQIEGNVVILQSTKNTVDNKGYLPSIPVGNVKDEPLSPIESTYVPMAMPEPLAQNIENTPINLMPQSSIIPPAQSEFSVPNMPVKEINPVINKRIIVEEKNNSSKTDIVAIDDVIVPPPTKEEVGSTENIAYSDVKNSVPAMPTFSQPQEQGKVGDSSFLIQEEESVWNAKNGDTLRTVLQQWSDAQNVSLVWDSEYDYPIQSDVNIVGNFQKAVRDLLNGFANADPKPLGKLYMNKPAGVPVLVIESNRISQ